MRFGKNLASGFYADCRDRVAIGKACTSGWAYHGPFQISTDIRKLNHRVLCAFLV